MKWRERIRDWLWRDAVPPKRKSGAWDHPLWVGENEAGPALLTNVYEQSVWVYACVQRLAENVAQVPFRFSRGQRRGEELVERGPLVDLFEQPHPQLHRFDFWELLVAWLMLRGRAFVVPITATGGTVNLADAAGARAAGIQHLLVLPPEHFRRVMVEGQLVGWHFTAGPDSPWPTWDFLPGEVLYARLPHVYHFWDGLAPLSVAQLAAQTDYASAQFMKGLMRNNADTGVIVRTKQILLPEQREQVLAALRERKRGAGLPDRPLVLDADLEVVKPEISSADLQFLENRKFNRQEICAVFGVPQEILGFTEDANRSVSESARRNFIEQRVAPLCQRLEAAFAPLIRAFGSGSGHDAAALRLPRTSGIAPGTRPNDNSQIYGWFDVDALPIMQAARRARLDTARKAWELGVPFNELNRVYDLGFTELPWGNTGYLPGNVQVAGDLEGEQSPPDGRGTAAPAGAAMRAAGIGGAAGPWARLEGLLSAAAREGTAALAHPTVEPATQNNHPVARAFPDHPEYAARAGGLEGRLRKYLFEQRGRALARLHAQTLITHATLDLMTSQACVLLDGTEENGQLMARVRPLIEASFEAGRLHKARELGQPDFQPPPGAIQRHLDGRQTEMRQLNDLVRVALGDALAQGVRCGETMEGLARRVKAVYQEAAEVHAPAFAREEIQRALEAGRQAVLEVLSPHSEEAGPGTETTPIFTSSPKPTALQSNPEPP